MMNRWLMPVLALLTGAAPVLAQCPVIVTAAYAAQHPSPEPGGAAEGKPDSWGAASPPAAAPNLDPSPSSLGLAGPERWLAPGGAGPGVAGREGQLFWVSGDYLLWWIKDSHLPPLVTTGTAAGQGRLDRPGTAVLFGGDLDHGEQSGGRFDIGLWLDDAQEWSLQADVLALGQRSVTFAATSEQFPVLGRPFFDLTRQTQAVEVIAFPGVAAGSVAATSTSRLWGLDVDGSKTLCCNCSYKVDLLAGLRYLDLREDIALSEASTVNADVHTLPSLAPRAGTSAMVSDAFAAGSRFLGGQLGVSGEVCQGPWVLTFLGKLALGGVKEEVAVAGAHQITRLATSTSPGHTGATQGGGFLAQPGDTGDFTRKAFAAVPEVGITLGYQVADHVRLSAGYSFLYWSDVFRPEDRIEPVLSGTRSAAGLVAGQTGAVHARAPLQSTDFWAQGLSVGLEFRY
jgi:hypothetical protein